jgi:hypothetical protein
MKRKFSRFVLLFVLGLMLTVITSVGFQGCEKANDCNTAISSVDECFNCLNKNGGCYNGNHIFIQGKTCKCQ